MNVPSGQITVLLQAWSNGDDQALSRLTALVYEELYRLARARMARENPGHVLQNTALVNEIYLRLGELPQRDWQGRSHFFSVCSQLMRHILVDYARSRLNLKHGRGAPMVSFHEGLGAHNPGSSTELIKLDDALRSLAALDERKSQVVQMRFFGGLSVKEIAEALNVSERTVKEDWHLAKLWLLRELNHSDGKCGGELHELTKAHKH